ncbi:MAG: two-component system chemotaxis sensor kinase CheA [Clostridium sp.]|jgi:two-component system chemotaxis sensor kinase CheA
MGKKRYKRSLKKRITKTVSMLNFFSLGIMLITMMITLGIVFKVFSSIIVKNAASHMSSQLKVGYMEEQKKGNISEEFTGVTPYYEHIFKTLGESYKVLPPPGEELKKAEGADTEITMREDMSLVDYNIWSNGKLIYDSLNKSQKKDIKQTPKQDNWLIQKLITETLTTESVVIDNKELFVINVKLNPFIIIFGYLGLAIICVAIFLIVLIISRFIANMLSNVIVKPLSDLEIKMKELADGNIEAAIKTEIKFKKPIIEVEKLASYTNIIMSRMREYVDTFANQNTELEAQNLTLHENSETLENINKSLDNKNIKLKNIFNNVEQGFLTFGSDLRIQNEYSLECEKLFNEFITGETLSSLLNPKDMNMQNFIDDLLTKIFISSKYYKKIYIPLLPEEVTINNRVINLSYKVVKNEVNEDIIMVIITDITEKRLLEKLMDEERSILKMVVKTMMNRDDFKELVVAYKDFTAHSFKEARSEDSERIIRQIHTFKGNFSQYMMVNLVPKLDELENKLYEKKDEFSINHIDNAELNNWLEQDLNILEIFVGKDFIKEGEIFHIKKEKLIEIEKTIQESLNIKESRIILPLIKSLRYKSVKDLLKTYPDYVMQLGERLSKNILPFNITGDNVMVDTSNYQEVFKSLVHIFRNSVDHGIETEDERLNKGKDQIGNIQCVVKDLKGKFQIIISDDGRGINIYALEQKCIKEGICTKEELNTLSGIQKFELIYKDGITTKEEATYISGRGVGLSAVKQYVSEASGIIDIESKKDRGTMLTNTLPKLDDRLENVTTPQKFAEEMIKNAKNIILSQTGLDFKLRGIETKKTISLNNITALFSLKGTLNSLIMISANKAMAKRLVRGFIIDEIAQENVDDYVEDVLGEISNTILGNTFGRFENTKNIFHMGIPAVLSNTDAYIKYTQSKILSCELSCGEYEFSINMLLVEEDTYIEEET